MNFIEKKNAHDRLLGVTHLEADRRLLEQKNPMHSLLSRACFNQQQRSSELLWALLDYVSAEDIVAYRRKAVAESETELNPNPQSDSEQHTDKDIVVDTEHEVVENDVNKTNPENKKEGGDTDGSTPDQNTVTSVVQDAQSEIQQSIAYEAILSASESSAVDDEKGSLEEELGTALEENEELRETVDDLETELEATRDELETEKKSQQKPRSRSKKNIQQ